MTTLIMTKDDVIDVDSGNDELVSPQKETVSTDEHNRKDSPQIEANLGGQLIFTSPKVCVDEGNSLSAPSTVVKTGVIERKKSIRVSKKVESFDSGVTTQTATRKKNPKAAPKATVATFCKVLLLDIGSLEKMEPCIPHLFPEQADFHHLREKLEEGKSLSDIFSENVDFRRILCRTAELSRRNARDVAEDIMLNVFPDGDAPEGITADAISEYVTRYTSQCEAEGGTFLSGTTTLSLDAAAANMRRRTAVDPFDIPEMFRSFVALRKQRHDCLMVWFEAVKKAAALVAQTEVLATELAKTEKGLTKCKSDLEKLTAKEAKEVEKVEALLKKMREKDEKKLNEQMLKEEREKKRQLEKELEKQQKEAARLKKEEEEKAKKESLIEKNKMQFHKFGFKPVSASASTTVIEKKKATSGVDVEIPFSTPYLTPNEYTLLAKAPFGPSPERILYRSVDDSPAALDPSELSSGWHRCWKSGRRAQSLSQLQGRDSQGRKFRRFKLLQLGKRIVDGQQFDAIRPQYWGTFSKATFSLRGRTPFKMEERTFNYDVDSEEEWTGEEEEGEEIVSGDENEDMEDDDADEEDGFVVPDDYIDGEGADETTVRPKMEAKKVAPLQMRAIGPLFGDIESMARVDEHDLSFLASFRTCILFSLAEVAANAAIAQAKATSNGSRGTKPDWDDAMLPALAKFVEGKAIAVKAAVKEFQALHPHLSKRQLTLNLDRIAVKEKREGDSKPRFYIKEGALSGGVAEGGGGAVTGSEGNADASSLPLKRKSEEGTGEVGKAKSAKLPTTSGSANIAKLLQKAVDTAKPNASAEGGSAPEQPKPRDLHAEIAAVSHTKKSTQSIDVAKRDVQLAPPKKAPVASVKLTDMFCKKALSKEAPNSENKPTSEGEAGKRGPETAPSPPVDPNKKMKSEKVYTISEIVRDITTFPQDTAFYTVCMDCSGMTVTHVRECIRLLGEPAHSSLVSQLLHVVLTTGEDAVAAAFGQLRQEEIRTLLSTFRTCSPSALPLLSLLLPLLPNCISGSGEVLEELAVVILPMLTKIGEEDQSGLMSCLMQILTAPDITSSLSTSSVFTADSALAKLLTILNVDLAQ